MEPVGFAFLPVRCSKEICSSRKYVQTGLLHHSFSAEQKALRVSLCKDSSNGIPLFSQEPTIIRMDMTRN